MISALAYAHAKGIKHEDIKLSNILIKSEQIYLTDFGSPMDFSDLDESSITDVIVQGTPSHWAPEPRPWERGADVFALGCAFSEMITVRQHKCLAEYRRYRFNPTADYG